MTPRSSQRQRLEQIARHFKAGPAPVSFTIKPMPKEDDPHDNCSH